MLKAVFELMGITIHGWAWSDAILIFGLPCRLSAANQVISRPFRSAKVANTLEPRECSRTDGLQLDGLTLVPWKRGRSFLWDFTCVDTFTPTHLPATSVATTDAVAFKHRTYIDLAQRYLFVPVAVETSGCEPRGTSFCEGSWPSGAGHN